MNSRELSKIRLLKTKRKEKTTNPRLRNPSAKKDWKKCETPRHKNHPNTGLGDPSKTFPKFRDWAKIEAHETESPTPNCTVTFQLCQTGSDSEGLPPPPRVSSLIGTLIRNPGGYPPATPQPAWKIEWTFDLFCVSVFQDSLVVIVIVIDSGKKCKCKPAF